MANSKYEYVKGFEQHATLLRQTWIVIRIDGRGFHRFTAKHEFTKPNDLQGLGIMNAAAKAVMSEIPEICLAYGLSDEYSFVFDRATELFERRESKLVTTIASTFTAYYIHLWPQFFPDRTLSPPLPSFDGRAVTYPTTGVLRDYLRWRQVDCHINNLYNTTFWALILQGGMTEAEAEEHLKGTVSSDKNEILFSRFDINYNKEPEIYKKGSILYRNYDDGERAKVLSGAQKPMHEFLSKSQAERQSKRKSKATIELASVDIIKDAFWDERPWILGPIQGFNV